jgi:hypothetical protein
VWAVPGSEVKKFLLLKIRLKCQYDYRVLHYQQSRTQSKISEQGITNSGSAKLLINRRSKGLHSLLNLPKTTLHHLIRCLYTG